MQVNASYSNLPICTHHCLVKVSLVLSLTQWDSLAGAAASRPTTTVHLQLPEVSDLPDARLAEPSPLGHLSIGRLIRWQSSGLLR